MIIIGCDFHTRRVARNRFFEMRARGENSTAMEGTKVKRQGVPLDKREGVVKQHFSVALL